LFFSFWVGLNKVSGPSGVFWRDGGVFLSVPDWHVGRCWCDNAICHKRYYSSWRQVRYPQSRR